VRKLSRIWPDNSRVGLSTSTRQLLRTGGRGLAASRCRIGSAKAAVLPVPVWAIPITSRPDKTVGIVCAWIGVGVRYFSSASARVIASLRVKSRKEVNEETFLRTRFLTPLRDARRPVLRVRQDTPRDLGCQ